MTRSFIVYGRPVGKPRMTRRDTWKKRECVVRYRSWADEARAAMGRTTKYTLRGHAKLTVWAFFTIPKSHRTTRVGDFHTVKPDADNILKAVCDALFENDQMVVQAVVTKLWAGSDGERVKIEIEEVA